jgi:hypothetical protein
VPAREFWEAEPEHQGYLERVPNGYTCHFVRRAGRFPTKALQTSRLNARHPRQSNISSGTSSAAAGNDGNSIARR